MPEPAGTVESDPSPLVTSQELQRAQLLALTQHEAIMVAELQHPVLGTVLGTKSKDVVQYRGIPFATLTHPFAAPVVRTQYNSPIDATHLG